MTEPPDLSLLSFSFSSLYSANQLDRAPSGQHDRQGLDLGHVLNDRPGSLLIFIFIKIIKKIAKSPSVILSVRLLVPFPEPLVVVVVVAGRRKEHRHRLARQKRARGRQETGG